MFTYEEWLERVPQSLKTDPLWKMKVYRDALFLGTLARQDVLKLAKERSLVDTANQLHRAVGSIGANIAEGYSRSSKLDQARFYEYALGSGRESYHWYLLCIPPFSQILIEHRGNLIAEISRQLSAIIPRTRQLHEDGVEYDIDA